MNRKKFLKNLGIGLSLPLLPSALPRHLWAEAENTKAPMRLAFVYAPNGQIMKYWKPKQIGKDYNLPQTLHSLNNLKENFQILSGLDHQKAFANGDGAGDHARANATFLTGCQAKKTSGPNIKLGISVDQIAANAIGHQTLLPSLELSCDRKRTAGSCDNGYSCAYQFNISWKSESTPMTPESSPQLAYERLFAKPFGNQYKPSESSLKRSLLDQSIKETQALQSKLGAEDKQKLEEYLTSLRALEKRIQHLDRLKHQLGPKENAFSEPKNFQEHIKMMYDIMLLAFQSDTTRVISFLLAHDGSNRSFTNIGVNEKHHQLSHHKNNPEKIEKIAKIDKFYMDQFSIFLQNLKNTKDQQGSLLDHSMILYGSGISDGNTHSHRDLPILFAGKGGGLKPGRHTQFPKKTPVSNLYVSLLNRMNIPTKQMGDSTGILSDI